MRKTMALDFQNHYDTVINVINDCKEINPYKVFYGKAAYGYFVQVYCSSYQEGKRTCFNTDTKAGARRLAQIIAEDLQLPLESDWD